MNSVIVGTAGHIDHGKTALVKALTGIDADRLEEEKRRGITIDLGFAHLELPSAPPAAPGGPGGELVRLGFIDVPGHERFVRNMLAGIGGIDLLLLVIAADESIRPQTREHFDICRLLNVQRGLTVLTKSDLVDSSTLEVARLEVAEFLRGSFLEAAPIVAVSSLTGQGLEELRQELARLAAAVPSRDTHAFFRLPVDRVFTMKGFGTVVTGTLLSGRIAKETEVEIFPTGQRVRVRGIQVHGQASDAAQAGQRVALNLAGADTAELARGMTLAPAGHFRACSRIDAWITLLPGAPPLRDRARVHFHAYTAETIAEVVLLGPDNPEQSTQARKTDPRPAELRPGLSAWAQLRLAQPLLLLPEDRFILRQFSPVVTIGGGVVADNAPLPLRLGREADVTAHIAQLGRLTNGSRRDRLAARVARRESAGLTLADAVAETGASAEELPAGVLRFGEVLIASAVLAAVQTELLHAVSSFHDANPLVPGIGQEQLRRKLDLGTEIFSGALADLARAGKLQVSGETVRQAGRGVVMKSEESESKRRIEQAFATAGLKAPALKDVLASLKLDRARAQRIVTLLLRERTLIKIADELVFHRQALEQLRRQVAEYKKISPRLNIGAFKDLTGVSRKYAIPLLQYLDQERITRREGDDRIIL